MWARNALFLTIFLAGVLLVVGSLMRRDRVEQPRDFQPQRFQPVALSVSSPAANPAADTLARLNAEFHEHWQSKGLQVASRADDLTIARRLSLALVGTVPSLEEIRALERVAPEQRIEWWTSHLLEDRRHSDYWAERWARAFVGNENGPFLVFRRRRFTMWLSDRLHENMAYDEIVRKLLAEEGIWTGKPATNFITAASDPNNDNQPDPVRLAGRTARALLGMRIDCLQCHDDRLGTILLGSPENIHGGMQADFHQLAAFFGSTRVSLVGVKEGNKPYKTKYLNADEEEVVRPDVPFADELRDGHGKRREQLARWVTHPQNKAFARATVNRVWALLFGKPLVEPIDDIPLVGRYPPGIELLAEDFAASGFDLQRLVRLIAASDIFQRDSRGEFGITEKHESAWAVFPLSRLRPEQMAGSLVQAASLTTIDGQAHIVQQIIKFGQTNDFVQRYGDLGEDEFTGRGSTIPQRLLMMNGNLVKERTEPNPVMNASSRIASLTRKPGKQIEAAYLAILTRRPSEDEHAHFVEQLKGREGQSRAQAIEDLYWVLLNSTEFSWNH